MKTYWKYHARATGIKKRGRKVDSHLSDCLGTSEFRNDAEAERLAREWVRENIKTADKVQACATYWTSEHEGSELWEPFTEAHNWKKYITTDGATK